MVWVLIVAFYNIGSSIKVNQCDKPHVIAKAKYVCMQCECEFNERVNCIEIPAIREKLNTTIYSLDIRDSPVIQVDVN